MRMPVVVATGLILGSALAGAGEPPISMDPWLPKEVGVTDVSLEGEWQLSELGIWCVRFNPHIDSDSIYDVYVDDAMRFTASLHWIDGRLLLVVGQETPEGLVLSLPVYWLFKLELDGDTMRLFPIDSKSFDWRAAGANIERKGDLVLSPTKDLMAFVRWQVGDPSFFDEEPAFTFKRMESD